MTKIGPGHPKWVVGVFCQEIDCDAQRVTKRRFGYTFFGKIGHLGQNRVRNHAKTYTLKIAMCWRNHRRNHLRAKSKSLAKSPRRKKKSKKRNRNQNQNRPVRKKENENRPDGTGEGKKSPPPRRGLREKFTRPSPGPPCGRSCSWPRAAPPPRRGLTSGT